MPSLYTGAQGFEGAVLLLNRTENKAKSITLWKRREDFEAMAATPAYREAMSSLGAHFISPPELEEWEHGGSYFPPK